LSPPAAARRVYVAAGADDGVARRLRGEGWITVAALGAANAEAEARRLGCGHLLVGDRLRPL